jgi:hypothetical protein
LISPQRVRVLVLQTARYKKYLKSFVDKICRQNLPTKSADKI